MIKAVVFDLDNTVYDYDFCHKKAMDKLRSHACKKYNINESVFEKQFACAKEEVKRLLGDTGSSHNRILYMQVFLEKIGMKPANDALELYDIYWDSMLSDMKTFEYVKPLMMELEERNIRIGVLTDLTAHIQHRKIAKLGIGNYISALVTSEEVGVEKPSICGFIRILDKLECSPNEVVMIGDSKRKDVEGAINAGMHGLLFVEEYRNDMHSRVMELINNENI